MILVVNEQNPTAFEKVDASTFIQFNIWERRHIQEWIRQAPEVLGEDLLVVSIEFDRFHNSSDRLDILAIDTRGNLVVIELKRDSFAGYADLQAIRYAAMVSSMTLEKLVPYFVNYQKKYLGLDDANSDRAFEQLVEFAKEDNDHFEELSNRPRIILCSEDFSPEVTTTVLWLNQSGLDVACVRIKPHRVGNQIVIVPDKIIPIQEAKQFMTEIQQKEETRQQENSRVRSSRPNTIKLLLRQGLLKAGDRIYLKDYAPDYVTSHIQPGDARFIAEITGKTGMSNTVRWLHDGKEYSLTNLSQGLFQSLHPQNNHPGPLAGSWFWQDVAGRKLSDWGDEVWQGLNQPS